MNNICRRPQKRQYEDLYIPLIVCVRCVSKSASHAVHKHVCILEPFLLMTVVCIICAMVIHFLPRVEFIDCIKINK